MAVPFLTCMALVASLYNLPPRVLPAIQAVEGGIVTTVHRNTDGTEDLGMMQINTRWLPFLSRYTRSPEITVRENLLGRGCYNIAAAGLIMRIYLDETHGDLMRAIGNYHSHTLSLNQAYRAKVMQSAARLFTLR
jgi:hypothetical protein